MTTPNLSAQDQARLDSGDYVIDPVFGVQPKTPQIQQRDYEASLVEASLTEQATPVPTPAPKAPVAPKDNPQP